MFVGWPWDKLFSADFVRETGLRFQEQRSTNDALFVFMAVALAPRMTAVTRVLVTYRIGNNTSISNTRSKSFDCAWAAMQAIRKSLIDRGIYSRFEHTFVNWQVHFSLWNYNTLTGEAKSGLGRLICGELAEQVDAASRPEGFFEDEWDITQFREISETFSDWFDPADAEMLAQRPWTPPAGVEGSPDCPDVSVIVPIYNVEQYVEEALDSLERQTLANIEIVCIVDGATDRSLDLAKRHAARDPRIVVVNKSNSGYGASMNLGIRCARGRYIGILEPDDFVLPEMFSSLFEAAESNDAQIVKSDFYRFAGEGDSIERTLCYVGCWTANDDRGFYNRVFCPVEEQECFIYEMNTWSGIYRRDFLLDNGIWHNETPGASYQDNGFWFKGYCLAERLLLIESPGYMNRRDNPGSSMHDRGKSLAPEVEYELLRDWLLERPELFAKVSTTYWRKFRDNLWTTLIRIDSSLKREVLEVASAYMLQGRESGDLDLSKMPDWLADECRGIMDEPLGYYIDTLLGRIDGLTAERDRMEGEINWLKSENARLQGELDEVYGSHSFKVGSALMKVPSALKQKIRGNE